MNNQKGSFLLTAIVIIFLVVLITGVYLWYTKQESTSDPKAFPVTSPSSIQTATIVPSPLIAPTPIDSDNTVWKSFTLKSIPLTFKLPPALLELGEWREVIVKGDTGNKLCFELNEEPESRGAVGSCYFNSFVIAAVTDDFSAGRGGNFTDLMGEVRESSNEFHLIHKGISNKLPPQVTKKILNPLGTEIITVKPLPDEHGFSPYGLPDDGTVGAHINTGNSSYKGIRVVMRQKNEFFDSAINEAEFDKILSTFIITQ